MTPDNQPDNTPQRNRPSDVPSDVASPDPTDATSGDQPVQPRGRRRRRWLIGIGTVVGLLILLVLLAPTLLSTKPMRSFVVGKINDSLNGRMEIADWDLSWTGGVKVNGLRLFDDRNSQIAQIESITTELSLLGAARGDLALGETVIRGADFDLIQDPDGSINFARLVKPSDKPDEPASDLPNLSGNIRLENSRGTFVRNTGDPKTSQKVKMSEIAATVAIADINQPIDHTFAVTASVNDGPAGTLSVKGKADVIADRRVNLGLASFDETIELKNFDAGAVAGFLPPSVVRQLSGTLNGSVVAQFTDGKSVVVRSQIDGKQIIFATAAFADDETYRAETLTLLLPLTISLPNGLADFQAGVVRTDGAVSVNADNTKLSVAVDAPIATLLSAASNETPKLPGKINQKLSADLAPLAAMMPKTLGMRADAKLDSGRLEQSVTADLSPGQSQLAVVLNVTQVEGSTQGANPEGSPVRQRFSVEPIVINVSSVSGGGGWKAPDLRDLSLKLTSGFASGEFTAPTLASLKGNIDADLAKLKAQMGQFMELQDVPLSGKVNLVADSTGDPTRPTDPATFSVTLTGTEIRTAVGGKPFTQAFVRASLGGTVLRTSTGDVQQVRDVKLSAVTGSETSPTVDLQITVLKVEYVPSTGAVATENLSPARYDVPAFVIDKANIALKPAQADFGSMVPALREYDFAAGVASIRGAGSYVNGALAFDGAIATTDVNFGRQMALSDSGPASRIRQRVDVLVDYNLTANLAVSYQPLPEGGARLAVAKLQLSDNKNLLSMSSTGDLLVTLPEAGTPTAAGTLNIGLDLAQAHILIRRLTATTQDVIAEATSSDKPVLIHKGQLAGTVNLNQQPNGGLLISLDGGVDALTVAGDQPIVTDEKVTLKVDAATGPAMASAVLEQLQLTSGVASVHATGQFVLTTGGGEHVQSVPPLQMVQKLSATVTTPDLAKLQAVLDALQPTPKQTATLGPPAPAVPTWRPESAQIAAADDKLPPGTPIPESVPAEPTLFQQIAEVQVTELTAAGVGVNLVLKQPIRAIHPAELLELFTGQTAQAELAKPAVPATAPTPTTQPTPVPPPKLAGGSATIKLEMTGNGQSLTIVPDVQAQKLALSVGDARRDLGDITMKSSMVITSQPANVPAPATANPSLAGAFTITGQIEPLMELSAFLNGEKPQSSYAGALNFEQTVGTEGKVIKLAGGGTVTDFVARDAAGKPAFTENTIRIADDLSMDTAGAGTLLLNRAALIFESSGALNLEANGKIHDLGKSRVIEYVLANVSYDAAKLWQILRPMLADPGTPPDQDPYKDYVIAGKASRQFALGGSLPALDEAGNAVPMSVALRSLVARGSIGLDTVQAEGLTIQSIELPVSLNAGILKTIDVTKPEGQQMPAPYICNGGTIDIGGIEVDLNGDVPLLSTPTNLAILNKVQLNAALSKFLGDLVNNPLFVPSAETKGIIDATIAECRNVPLGKQFAQHGGGNQGYAVASFSFSGAQFKNDFIVGLTNGLANMTPLKLNADSWQGSIRNGKVTYKNGYVGHDMTLVLGEQQEKSIRLYGNTRLSDKTMVPLTMLFSSEWFGGDFSRYVPKGLPLALSGPFNAPRYDLAAAVQQTIRQNYLSGKPDDIGRIIDLFTGKKKDDKAANNPPPAPGDDPATRPAAKPADNPLGIFGDLLGQAAKERERKEQEKREREKREQERRRQRQQDR